MKTLREYETMRPWAASRSVAAAFIRAGRSSHAAKESASSSDAWWPSARLPNSAFILPLSLPIFPAHPSAAGIRSRGPSSAETLDERTLRKVCIAPRRRRLRNDGGEIVQPVDVEAEP